MNNCKYNGFCRYLYLPSIFKTDFLALVGSYTWFLFRFPVAHVLFLDRILLSPIMSDRYSVTPIKTYITSIIVIGMRKNANADIWNMYIIVSWYSSETLHTKESVNGSLVFGSKT